MVLVTTGKDREFVGIFIGDGDASAFIDLAIEEDNDLSVNDFVLEEISNRDCKLITSLFFLKG